MLSPGNWLSGTFAIYCILIRDDTCPSHLPPSIGWNGSKSQVLLALKGRGSREGRTHWGYQAGCHHLPCKAPSFLFFKFMFPTSLLVPRTFPAHCHPHPWHGYRGCDLCTWRRVYIVKYYCGSSVYVLLIYRDDFLL